MDVKCKSKDPVNCKYHGKGRKVKILTYKTAVGTLKAAKVSLDFYAGHPNVTRKLEQEVEIAQAEVDATSKGFAELTEKLYGYGFFDNQQERNQLQARLMKAWFKRQAFASYSGEHKVSSKNAEKIWNSADKTNTVQVDEFKVVQGPQLDDVNACFYAFTDEGEPVAFGVYQANYIQSLAGLRSIAETFLSYNPKIHTY